MNSCPPLIAVIGPVETAMLNAWLSHYQSQGIDRFLLALHAPDAGGRDQRDLPPAACRECDCDR
jgi:hypothetical protein